MSDRMIENGAPSGAVYVQTNDATCNEIVVYSGAVDGALTPLGRYATDGRGTGKPHLASQSSVALGDDGRWLLVANAGSDELSLFAVEADGLRLADRVASGGRAPTSVAAHESIVYALNTGSEGAAPNITGFTLADGKLSALEGSTKPLSADEADPAQVSFSPDGETLVVTERGTNSISAYAIDETGHAGADDDRVLRRNSVRVRLRCRGRRRRDRGVRRGAGPSGRVLLRCGRAGPTDADQWVDRRYSQRGVLGSYDEGRTVRLRDELRRRDDLELHDRR